MNATFMKQLGLLKIRKPIRKRSIGEEFCKLEHIEQVEYMSRYIQIEVNTFDSWYYKSVMPSIDSLLSISRHFDVSIDYLLGNAERKESYSTQYIMDKTGLSQNAINNLTAANKNSSGITPPRPAHKNIISAIDMLLRYKPEILLDIGRFLLSSNRKNRISLESSNITQSFSESELSEAVLLKIVYSDLSTLKEKKIDDSLKDTILSEYEHKKYTISDIF